MYLTGFLNRVHSTARLSAGLTKHRLSTVSVSNIVRTKIGKPTQVGLTNVARAVVVVSQTARDNNIE